ncbi:MAG: YqcC family protein [Gammaproteobacteria bacterium]|nr:YqcC family protein [Gammaproteobacteria bacterium]
MRDELTLLLHDLERELRLQDRWQPGEPPAAALRSTEPFAVDVLDFDQWLQWILLPRMHELLLRQLPLPDNCAMQPMAEEFFAADDSQGQRIVALLAAIDALLTQHHGGIN